MNKNAEAKAAAVARYKAAFLAANGKPCELTEDYPGKFRISSTGVISHLGYCGWRVLDRLSETLERRAPKPAQVEASLIEIRDSYAKGSPGWNMAERQRIAYLNRPAQ